MNYGYPYGGYQYGYQQNQQYPNQQNNNQMMMQTSIIGVQNEDEARAFPVGPGNSITFRDESAPYIYTKTMGRSQLDRPTFEKYRLVKEDAVTGSESPDSSTNNKEIDLSVFALKTEIEPILTQIGDIRKELFALKKKKVVREVEYDDE